MEKVTKREVYEALVNFATTGAMTYGEENIVLTNEELSEFAKNEISLLDKKAVKAKERAPNKKAAGDELTEAVYAALTEEFEPIADITCRINDDDVTISKVTYRLRKLAEAGRAEKTDLTIPGSEGQKARHIVGYKKI